MDEGLAGSVRVWAGRKRRGSWTYEFFSQHLCGARDLVLGGCEGSAHGRLQVTESALGG